MQKYEYSFFDNIHHHCSHNDEAQSIETLPSCCRKAKSCANRESTSKEKNKHICCEDTPSAAQNDERGCTKRELKFFKLDIDLMNVSAEKVTFSSTLSFFLEMLPAPFHFDNLFISNLLYNFSSNKSPPQYLVLRHQFGRGLLNFKQVYRC
jgi:hypothetical protein